MLRLTADKKIISDASGEKEVAPEDVLQYLVHEPIASIDGWTLGDLMFFIEPMGAILGEMALCRFDKFIAEMKKPVEDESEFVNNIEYIMVSRNVALDDGVINEYCDVYGGNDTITDEQIQADFEANGHTELSNRYGIGMTSINRLANKPLRIDDSFVVREELMVTNDPTKEVFRARKPFYLLDVIWAILWEISFYGGPEERDEMAEELDRRVQSIKDGTAETVPLEEVMARLRGLTEGTETGDLSKPLDPADE